MHRPYVMVHCDTHSGLSETNYRDYVAVCGKLDKVSARGRKIHIGMTSHGRPGDVFVPRHDLDVRHALERAGVKYETVRMRKAEGDPDPQKFRRLFNEAVLGKVVTPAPKVEEKVARAPVVKTLKFDAPPGRDTVSYVVRGESTVEDLLVLEHEVRRRFPTVEKPAADADRAAFSVWSLFIFTHFVAGALGFLLGKNL